MPADLLAEARMVADQEHRPANELVTDAVRSYLEQRKQGPAVSTSPSIGPKKRLSELFGALRGTDIDLSRNPSTARPLDL